VDRGTFFTRTLSHRYTEHLYFLHGTSLGALHGTSRIFTRNLSDFTRPLSDFYTQTLYCSAIPWVRTSRLPILGFSTSERLDFSRTEDEFCGLGAQDERERSPRGPKRT